VSGGEVIPGVNFEELTFRPLATAARRSETDCSWDTRAFALAGSIFISDWASVIAVGDAVDVSSASSRRGVVSDESVREV
jgi:hypothetical protein